MKFFMLCSTALLELFGPAGLACAEELDVKLVSVKPHSSIERTHVCLVIKTDDATVGDCNEPKCTSGGTTVDAALASKGLKRICKTIDASVNRGFDVTYAVYGEEHIAWTAQNPEHDLNLIGLMVSEEHSPLNTACPQLTFKPASGIGDNESECAPMESEIDSPPEDDSK